MKHVTNHTQWFATYKVQFPTPQARVSSHVLKYLSSSHDSMTILDSFPGWPLPQKMANLHK